MNNGRTTWLARVLLAALAVLTGPFVVAEEYYYGIEMNGVLCGYSRMLTSPLEGSGGGLILLTQESVTKTVVLGRPVDSRLELTYHLDPSNRRFTYHGSLIEAGPTRFGSKILIEGRTARFSSSMDKEEKAVSLPEDVIFENTLFFQHLKEDFADRGLEERTYRIFEVREAQVQESTYTRVGRETVELAGSSYDAVILDRMNRQTGLKSRHWIDTRSGIVLKATLPNGRLSYLADASVVGRIQPADLERSLTARAGMRIPDPRAISYVKVKAVVEPSGLWVTPESLNVPGQRFTGTVKDNLVEGIFEVQHPRYDGSNAPPFPPDAGSDESLKEFLVAGPFIQSDDPVLVEKAREITGGSKDSWEAALRLSRWVAENIKGAIPGGITARGAYDAREGECGAHSFLLAAFCRAVGIPARVVWGCMYAPHQGGIFAQHGWNEVHMGAAGWIPLDTTLSEIDYVDSGHIRVGVFQSPVAALNPARMELLDYRTDPGSRAGAKGAPPASRP